MYYLCEQPTKPRRKKDMGRTGYNTPSSVPEMSRSVFGKITEANFMQTESNVCNN